MEKVKNIVRISNRDNTDEKAAHLRDTFLKAESEYVEELLKKEEFAYLVDEISELSSEELFQAASRIVSNVELNLIDEEDIEVTEQQLIIILSAIQDKVLAKGEQTKTM